MGDKGVMMLMVLGGATLLVTTRALLVGWIQERERRIRLEAERSDLPRESLARLERIERGMEALAIEGERLSEGQRFVAKLLSGSTPPPQVAARAAEPRGVTTPR